MDIALIWSQITSMLGAPFHNPAMLWELIPVLLSLVVIELYFGLYKNEELGWNSSVSNSLVLFFASSNLLHYLYLTEQFSNTQSVIIAFSLAGFALLLLSLDFFHILPKRIAFGVSNSFVMNMMAVLGIIIVHENIALTGSVLLAALAIFFFFFILFFIIHKLEPDVSGSE